MKPRSFVDSTGILSIVLPSAIAVAIVGFAEFLAAHHLEQLHHVRGAEEVHADDVLRALRHRGHLVDVERGGVARENRAGLHRLVELLEDLFFQIEVLVHRFDDDVRVGNRVVVDHALDQAHTFVHLRLRDTPALNHPRVVLLDDAEAFLQRFVVDLEHFHRDADVREVHRDAAAHQSRADGRRRFDVLLRRFGRHVGNARGLTLGEKHVNHRGALRVRQTLREVVAFDFHAGVEAVDHHGGFDAFVRHLAVELAAQTARQKRFGFFENGGGILAIGEHLVGFVANQRERPALL